MQHGTETGTEHGSKFSNAGAGDSMPSKSGQRSMNSGSSQMSVPPHQEEGLLTKQIEAVTVKIPSATFLSIAFAAIGTSAMLRLAGKKHAALFVGEWVPTVLLLGLYNKLVKLEGSE